MQFNSSLCANFSDLSRSLAWSMQQQLWNQKEDFPRFCFSTSNSRHPVLTSFMANLKRLGTPWAELSSLWPFCKHISEIDAAMRSMFLELRVKCERSEFGHRTLQLPPLTCGPLYHSNFPHRSSLDLSLSWCCVMSHSNRDWNCFLNQHQSTTVFPLHKNVQIGFKITIAIPTCEIRSQMTQPTFQGVVEAANVRIRSQSEAGRVVFRAHLE